jgi:anti-anti-sigma regulatory factor
MAKQAKASQAVKTIKVAEDLRISGATAAYGMFQAAAAGTEARVMLDGRRVEKVDTAGIQTLLAGHHALTRAGKTVRWAGCSPQLKAAAELLGLAGALGLPE